MQGRDGKGGGFLRLSDESGHTEGPPGDLIRPVWSERDAPLDLPGLGLLVVESVRPGLDPDSDPPPPV